MTHRLLVSCLFALSFALSPVSAVADHLEIVNWEKNLGSSIYNSIWPSSWWRFAGIEKRQDIQAAGILHNPDGTPFLWLPQDTYSGKTFFDEWDFFDEVDPTKGQVNYVNKSTAQQMGLFWVADNGTVFMKADDASVLPLNTKRASVRITSQKIYDTGLFILDLNKAPWGCAIWPAFWTFADPWPFRGEIDILEGVHDNQYNQIAWHTDTGCYLDTNATFTGQVPNNSTNCDGNVPNNPGCDIVEWSRASYGPYFESQGGGVLAMKWDENDISIWSFFRAAIPADVTAGTPNPSLWGVPSATLMNTLCDIPRYFANHSVVFDITFCGDWAGNSYATSGCPGTCAERLTDPSNFVNATWSINSLKIYRKQVLEGKGTSSARSLSTFIRFVIAKATTLLLAMFWVLA